MNKIVTVITIANLLATAYLASYHFGSRSREAENPAARSDELNALAQHVLKLEKELEDKAAGEKKFREETQKSLVSSLLEAMLARRDVSIVGSEFKEAAAAEAEALTRKGEAEVWVPVSQNRVKRLSDGFEVATTVPLSTSGVYAKALKDGKKLRFSKIPKPIGGVTVTDLVKIAPID